MSQAGSLSRKMRTEGRMHCRRDDCWSLIRQYPIPVLILERHWQVTNFVISCQPSWDVSLPTEYIAGWIRHASIPVTSSKRRPPTTFIQDQEYFPLPVVVPEYENTTNSVLAKENIFFAPLNWLWWGHHQSATLLIGRHNTLGSLPEAIFSVRRNCVKQKTPAELKSLVTHGYCGDKSPCWLKM